MSHHADGLASMYTNAKKGGGWLCLADLKKLGVLTGGAVAGAVTPQSWDPAVANTLVRLYELLGSRNVDRVATKMAAVLPPSTTLQPRKLALDYFRMRLEDTWGRLRGMRAFGWQPEIEIEGIERVQEARARGRGVILWGMRFSSATAIKQAFYRAGLPLVHVSAEDHGAPSKTKLGVRVVAPMFCRAENPYLAARVQIPLDGSLAYLRRLSRDLRDNACISIFGEHQGIQNIEVSVLGARWQFALGAPSLAWRENSGLLTVYALRLGPYHYRIVLDEEIPVIRDISRKQFAALALEEYARRLERLIVAYPSDWQGWLYQSFGS